MTDEELIARLREVPRRVMRETHLAADRIEALVKERDQYRDAFNTNCLVLRGTEDRAERLEAAIDYILDGMAIDAPDYEIDPDGDFLDAANSDWVRDVLTRLAAAMKGADHD